MNHPFTLFGIKVTTLMLKSIFVALSSVGASVLLDYLNKKFKNLSTNISTNSVV